MIVKLNTDNARCTASSLDSMRNCDVTQNRSSSVRTARLGLMLTNPFLVALCIFDELHSLRVAALEFFSSLHSS